MAFRRRNRFRSRRRFRARPFRRRSSIRRRIIRRGLARRPLRPEVKWIDQFNTMDAQGSTVDAGTSQQWIVTPGTIGTGPARDQRIGNKVKFRKCMIDIHIENRWRATSDTYITRIRVILVTPRIDAANFLLYLSNFNSRTQSLDTNLVTIYHDKEYLLNNLVTAGVSPNTYAGTGDRSALHLKKVIPFPRTVEFRDGTGAIQDSKDSIYLLVCNENTIVSGAGVGVQYRTKTTYVDA